MTTQKISWTTGSGRTALVEIVHQTERTHYCDGHQTTVPCCKLCITAEVEGTGTVGSGRPEPCDHPVAVAKIGRLGIPAGPLARIEAAIAEVEATSEWQAKVARAEQARLDEAEYDAGYARVRWAMDTE